jgi:hypothetical protein
MEILENKYQEAHKLSHTEVLFSYYWKILINNVSNRPPIKKTYVRRRFNNAGSTELYS